MRGPRLLQFAVAAGWASAEQFLDQVHVVTRHGSRAPLVKSAQTLTELSDAALTPIGEKQHYDLGVWLRNRYPQMAAVYDPKKVILESSSLGRTMVSASSLALGLFDRTARDPNNETLLSTLPANVPVYGVQARNDIYIRAYDKCASFLARLAELYESAQWKDLEAEHVSLLRALALIPSFAKYVDNTTASIPLVDIWNVFDAVQVAKVECVDETSLSCQALPDDSVRSVLSDDDWIELKHVAHMAELMKYGVETAGDLVGGNLLQTILDRMRNDPRIFYLYSAHYPTILGLFSALKQDFIDFETIPSYASALIFEQYKDTNSDEVLVQLLYKPGDHPNGTQEVVQLRSNCALLGNCTFDDVAKLISNFSTEQWCTECNNTLADVCIEQKLMNLESASYSISDSCDSNRAPQVLGSFFGGLGAGLLGAAAVGWMLMRSKRANKAQGASGGNENSDPAMA